MIHLCVVDVLGRYLLLAMLEPSFLPAIRQQLRAADDPCGGGLVDSNAAYLAQAMRKVDTAIAARRESVVQSSAWQPGFKKYLYRLPFFFRFVWCTPPAFLQGA